MFSFLKSRKFIYWLIAIVFIFIIHTTGLLRPVENLVVNLLSPVNRYFHNIGITMRGSNQELSRSELAAQLLVLQEQRAQEAVDEAQMTLLLEENNKLREQLNFLDNHQYRSLSANILARQNLFDSSDKVQDIILDRGSRDGIVPGLAVVDEQGIIIGKVLESQENSARACLTVAPDCRLAVAILNQDRTIGLSDGDLGLTIKLDFIPQLEEINLGDIVISSGLGDNIPRGLVVGRVTQVNKQSNEIWQDVNIESLASVYNLTVVSVILP